MKCHVTTHKKILRCKLIKELISNSNQLYSLNDLIEEVNKQFKASNRTIDADIRSLKDGILGIPLNIEVYQGRRLQNKL